MLLCQAARYMQSPRSNGLVSGIKHLSTHADYIMVVLTSKLRDSKSEKELIGFWNTCVKATREEGSTIVDYQMYYHEGTRQTQCFEYYASSESIVQHQRMSGAVINAGFMDHLEPQPPMAICGQMDDETKKMFKMFPLQYFTYMAGSSDTTAYRKYHPSQVCWMEHWTCHEEVSDEVRCLAQDLCSTAKASGGILNHFYVSDADKRSIIVHHNFANPSSAGVYAQAAQCCLRSLSAKATVQTPVKLCGAVSDELLCALDQFEPIRCRRMPGGIRLGMHIIG